MAKYGSAAKKEVKRAIRKTNEERRKAEKVERQKPESRMPECAWFVDSQDGRVPVNVES